MSPISYQLEPRLTVTEFRQILKDSTLGERRPVEDTERLHAMLTNANLIMTARSEGHLIGISRALTDFVFCTYLSDLAVHLDFQRLGVGKELIRQTKLVAPKAKLILLSAPLAIEYYPKIGMKHHEHCFYIDHVEELT